MKVLRVFVVTNHRFTDTFRRIIMEGLLAATPIPLECESFDLEEPPKVKQTFNIVCENITMQHGTFTCLGYTEDNHFFRLEEEMGTLLLHVT